MYRLMHNGAMIALGENLRYIRMQENGSYGFCDKEDAQGVAMDSKPYHIDGMDELAGAETVSVETVEAGTIVMDLAAASAVYAKQADEGNVPESDISLHPDLFPRLKGDGSLVEGGKHINWHGTVKRSRTALWDTVENDPDHAPELWEDIAYRHGIRIIPAVITAEGSFAKDEQGWWGDELYRSKIPANVHTPVQYPAGWELVTCTNPSEK